ncbi:hypothetical protein ISF_00020 [Cordyceps fumosorosea ARSEF 2679]|uniref:Uncharacterized protein n=1 Tax=Cordyceps fumosorosea (strain ARSEF 2679) TaxID=1081104 RepID=A0A162MZL3_CORFA|nr:hypothetical protein ISF_00020 [Cordyceps fumosorosea ARSEF 2679]OAA73119.1 hypothetical protein ISF_00020 [Cordyceps fumosorosea ARSEF 2679]
MAGGTQRQVLATGNGVLFEVVFKNADPRKKPNGGISLSYGGQVYRCNDAASIGSVHTIYNDDEDGAADSSKSDHQGKMNSQGSPRKPVSPSACLKKIPGEPVLRSAPSLKSSPKKLKRSRTLSPSHQSRARSLLAPLSNLSRKLAMRRHSYDEDTKTKREKSRGREDKARPLPDRRPVLQSVPYSFPQVPPPLAYQNRFPMYQYVPAPQHQPVFGVPPMAYPMTQNATNTTPQLPPELQQLQDRINHVTIILAANPIDLNVKRELNRLIAERNSFLDSATKRTVPSAAPGPVEPAQPKADDVRPVAGREPADKPNNKKLQKKDTASTAPSDASVVEERHICSGCGEERSPSFHRKHPFTKAVHNVCRKCREGKRAHSVMKRYHFCDSCGIVRSKEYHRRCGSASFVSARSKICRKCHAHGSYMRQSTDKESHYYKKRVNGRKHGEFADRKPSSRTLPPRDQVLAEPQAYKQPIRQTSSADNSSISGYDGASDLISSTRDTEPPQIPHPPAKASPFTNYRSPEISDEDASSDQPVSLESSFHSFSPGSPSYNEPAAPNPQPVEVSSLDDPTSESSEASFVAPQHTTSSSNPYYQPRGTAGRLSSSFHFTEASLCPPCSPPVAQPFSQVWNSSSPGVSPERPDFADKPRFVDRNQSWPGNLNQPSAEAFSCLPGTARKVSASEGARTPQASPTAPDFNYSPIHTGDEGEEDEAAERFTTGAFGRIPSSFKPSPPSSPLASFSGPISNPAPETGSGSKGAYYHEPSAGGGGCGSSAGSSRRESSAFDSYNPERPASPSSLSLPFRFGRGRPKSYSRRQTRGGDGGGEFASTRGAWNINTSSSASSFARHATDGGNEHGLAPPEPIIEEPSSPAPKSPTTTPLLLGDLSDSAVEFLTGSSSSPSSSACSSEESLLLASHLNSLSVHSN